MSYQQANWPYNELITTPGSGVQNYSTTPTHPNPQLKLPSIIKFKSRQPRFTESTTVHSPVETGGFSKPYGAESCRKAPMTTQIQASDVGLAFIKDGQLSQNIRGNMPPRVPGSTSSSSEVEACEIPRSKGPDPLSPTLREEQTLQKCENLTENEQAKDLKVKIRVRMAKFFLRGISFGCSLIVLTMVSASFSIFNATKSLAPRNHLSAWASGTKTWPQIFILTISCASLLLCLIVFWNYFRGGHRKAEKVATYYTAVIVMLFVFSSIMWGMAAGVLQGSRSTGQNKDMWGWSCVDNKRRQLFSDKVNYALVCRMQNWVLVCCIIEIVLESITILLYAFVFYRYYSKQRLRKSMHIRDRARSELYTAQIRTQSTALMTSSGAESQLPPRPPMKDRRWPLVFYQSAMVEKRAAAPTSAISAKPFCLQPPPRKASFRAKFKNPIKAQVTQQKGDAVNPTPGPVYETVPIPNAYPTSPTQNGNI